MKDLHHWTVRYTDFVPWDTHGKEYVHNFNDHVLAPDILTAIRKVQSEHPRATVWGASHHGQIKYIAENHA